MIKLSPEVQEAIDTGKPVVALESTIIAHGMPFPQNLAMARGVEKIIRDNGAAPATIAVINGELRAGLAEGELEQFARMGNEIAKVSTRDLPYVVARGISGATTVASTMRLAEMAGIAVFATGGIGGVHRGAGDTFDISNDLTEFAQSNVAVVTAGAKSILDLAQTLEVLETSGVPVVGFNTNDFPAFYSRTSGHKVPIRIDAPEHIAKLMRAKWDMGLSGGIVIANPIMPEAEIPADQIEPVIEAALAEAKTKGIGGKHLTPFLLKQIAESTKGQSLRANIALVLNNANLATKIAICYAKL